MFEFFILSGGMKPMQSRILLALFSLILFACTSKNSSNSKSSEDELWIYTSMYKETIAEMEPHLKKQFPDLNIKFFQAGSEEVAAKVNAETMAGGTKADLLIFSDRFWFEEAASRKKLHAFKIPGTEGISESLKHKDNYYTALSLPVMVMIYNSDAVLPEAAPKTFKEMAEPKWKKQFTTGSPLASGTNFTTMAFLQKKYGWEYFKALRENDTISEGGNSSVLRRVQTKERPVGWILLENVLRLKGKDPKIKIVFPEDGAVLQANILAITKKESSRETAERVASFLFTEVAQQSIINSFMYSPLPNFPAPERAPLFSEISSKLQAWSPEFLAEVTRNRDELKEEYTELMFH